MVSDVAVSEIDIYAQGDIIYGDVSQSIALHPFWSGSGFNALVRSNAETAVHSNRLFCLDKGQAIKAVIIRLTPKRNRAVGYNPAF